MLADNTRQRIYITNSGMNRVEVFDMKSQTFLAPIKVGQLPHSMALGNDGSTLYVGSTGGEVIDIVNLDTMKKTGRVQVPAAAVQLGLRPGHAFRPGLQPARAADPDVGRHALVRHGQYRRRRAC